MKGVWVVHIASFQCSNVFQPAENITQLSYIKASYTHLLHLVNTKVKLLRVLLKNLDLHSFLETVIRLCEDQDYVTLYSIFCVFVGAPTRPFIDTFISWYMKGVEVVHICVKFHVCLICTFRVLKSEIFLKK